MGFLIAYIGFRIWVESPSFQTVPDHETTDVHYLQHRLMRLVERVVDIPHTKGLHLELAPFNVANVKQPSPCSTFLKIRFQLVHQLASCKLFVAMLLRLDHAFDLFKREAWLEYETLPELTTVR